MRRRAITALVFLTGAVFFFLPFKIQAYDVALAASGGVLTYDVTVPSFKLETLVDSKTRIFMEDADYGLEPGCPNLPTLSYTFALPPGTTADRVEITSTRTPVDGYWNVEVQPLPLPTGGSQNTFLESMYQRNQKVYASRKAYPEALGALVTSSYRREYSLATVVLYPFAYEPLEGKLSVASSFSIMIHYSPSEKEESSLVKAFLNKGTIHPDVPEHICNKDEARAWYKPSQRLLAAPRMLILTTNALQSSIEEYVTWREAAGFEVGTVTKEEILASDISGKDTQEKIRNWLRANAQDYDYLFIIGHFSDIPMRVLHGYGNDPAADPAWYYPAVSDIYYGDLSKPDASSWDSDGDGYYGEVLANGSGPTFDDPDLEMELHIGRINSSVPLIVESVLDKTILFESLNDPTYKTSAVTSASIPFYRTIDGEGLDGAIIMEYLQNAGILDRSKTTRLYEKGGDLPSEFECDLPETRENLVTTLQTKDVGIFVEYNHGSPTEFARFIVHDYNDNDLYDQGEDEWFTCLATTDAWKLNIDHPNVAFLMSCLNGKPEETLCLAEALIQNGSVAAVAHTRVSYSGGWHTPANGGFECLFYEDVKAFVQDSIPLGEAVSNARPVLRAKEPSWFFLNDYTHLLYGDPSLELHRYTPSADVREESLLSEPATLLVSSNNTVQFNLPQETYARLEMWDVAGRKVAVLFDGLVTQGEHSMSLKSNDIASGTYFITLRTDKLTLSTKAVVIK